MLHLLRLYNTPAWPAYVTIVMIAALPSVILSFVLLMQTLTRNEPCAHTARHLNLTITTLACTYEQEPSAPCERARLDEPATPRAKAKTALALVPPGSSSSHNHHNHNRNPTPPSTPPQEGGGGGPEEDLGPHEIKLLTQGPRCPHCKMKNSIWQGGSAAAAEWWRRTGSRDLLAARHLSSKRSRGRHLRNVEETFGIKDRHGLPVMHHDERGWLWECEHCKRQVPADEVARAKKASFDRQAEMQREK